MEFVDLSAIILLSQKTLSAQIFLLRLLEKIVIINPLLSPLFRRLLEIRKNLVVKRKKFVTTTGIFYRQNFDYRFKKLSVFSRVYATFIKHKMMKNSSIIFKI